MTTDRLLGMGPSVPEGRGSAGKGPTGVPPDGHGRLVGRRYRLLSPVGRGGMGMVWHAFDVLLDRDVAVKELILPPGLDHAGAQAASRRVLREARSAARLSHPGIITVHDVVEEDGRPWIVMELVRAWSLEQAVRQSGPLPVVQAAEIGVRVLDALRHAHAAGILHRDVKPGNVLLTVDRVVLTDFGIAAIEGDVTVTQTGLLMGSPAYIPPERLRGQPITSAADLWSFGATLYTAVEGRPPYEGPDAVAVLGAVLTQRPSRPQRAGALLPVIEGLLRKNPADRLSAAQVADMLELVLRQHGAGGAGRITGGASSVPTPHDPTPAALLPPLDLPSGPLPSRIIETPSGPVRIPLNPSDLPSGPYPVIGSDPSPPALPGPVTPAAPNTSVPEPGTARPRSEGGRRRERAAHGAQARGARWKLPVALTALGVLLTGAALFTLLPDDSAEQRPPQGTAQPAQPGEVGNGPQDTTSQPATPRAEAPKGYVIRTEGGVSVAVPKNWTVTVEDDAVVFTGPKDSGQSIRIGEVANGGLAALQTAEQNLDVDRHPDYLQIQLGTVDYRWPAADWEYTYTNQGKVTIHTLIRHVQIGARSYTITVTAPDFAWNESAAPVRQALWATFSPA